MVTVQEAVEDVKGLHSKLERKSNVERSNLASTTQFQQDIHTEVNSMCAELQSFATSQQQLCTNFSEKIGTSSWLHKRYTIYMYTCAYTQLHV